MTAIISTTQMVHALKCLRDTIEEEKEYLSEPDEAVGDGDYTQSRPELSLTCCGAWSRS